MTSINNPLRRRAVTFIEVLFSIGVVLIGLLGLLFILPLAGRRAQSAIDLAAASSYGNSVMNRLLMTDLLRDKLLRANIASTQYTLEFKSNAHTLELSTKSAPTTTPVKAFCIDPLYRSINDITNSGNTSVSAGFDDAQFPYYQAEYNPLLNPTASGSAWKFDSSLKTIIPVMNRLGVYRSKTTGYVVLSDEQARTFVESPDDLLVDRPKDRSKNPVLPALSSGSSLAYGRRVPTGEYTWIATVNPLEDNRFASVSVAVIRKRDTQKDFPGSFVTKPKENAQNERVAYVSEATGFSGGAGGSVRLVTTDSLTSDLTTGEWIMLSRFTSTFDYTTQPIPAVVHRWYRVASVEKEAQVAVTNGNPSTTDTLLNGKLPLPSGTANVWTRIVYLDGPDWNFGFETSGTEDFSNNTFATLFKNVVTVTERMVPLESL